MSGVSQGHVRKQGGQYYSPEYVNTVVAGACTVDWNNGNVQIIELSSGSSVTVTLTNFGALGGLRGLLLIRQLGASPASITWVSTPALKWQGGSPPTLTTGTNKIDLVGFVHSSHLSAYLAIATLNF